MKYYRYQNTKAMSKVWMLFKDLGDMSPEKLEKLYEKSDCSYSIEIIRAALNGSISLSDDSLDSFNLQAYIYKSRENEFKGEIKNSSKVLRIVDFEDSDKDTKESSVKFGDISSRSSKSLSYVDEGFERLMDSEEFKYNLRELYAIRSVYIVENGIDLVSVLIAGLKGIPEAIQQLKGCMQNDVKIDNLITSLCKGGSGRLLRILEAAT